MTKSRPAAGYFTSGLPFNRLGHGCRTLVILQGLLFDNKPLSGLLGRQFPSTYKFLEEDYTAYIVTRKPGLPEGYSLRGIANDYATIIRQEFGGPVDVIGVSTRFSILLLPLVARVCLCLPGVSSTVTAVQPISGVAYSGNGCLCTVSHMSRMQILEGQQDARCGVARLYCNPSSHRLNAMPQGTLS